MDSLRSGLVKLYGPREAGNILRLVGDRAQDELLANRLLSGEPVQYVLGETWFYGLRLTIDSNVLIPRPETEELVDWVIKENKHRESLAILDVGTGSGCIALALKSALGNARVIGIDSSGPALAVARSNAVSLGLDLEWIEADILQDVRLPQCDIIVSNPPYVLHSEAEALADNVRKFEPHEALFVPDSDPLVFYRRIGELAKHALNPGGLIYVETHEEMATQVARLFSASDYDPIEVRKDLSGKERMVRACYRVSNESR